ncbi:MAG: hypothetical protein J6A61_02865 [Clostridia bacterium]|nr:hypothetical protein [Clostridia bacterium]
MKKGSVIIITDFIPKGKLKHFPNEQNKAGNSVNPLNFCIFCESACVFFDLCYNEIRKSLVLGETETH